MALKSSWWQWLVVVQWCLQSFQVNHPKYVDLGHPQFPASWWNPSEWLLILLIKTYTNTYSKHNPHGNESHPSKGPTKVTNPTFDRKVGPLEVKPGLQITRFSPVHQNVGSPLPKGLDSPNPIRIHPTQPNPEVNLLFEKTTPHPTCHRCHFSIPPQLIPQQPRHLHEALQPPRGLHRSDAVGHGHQGTQPPRVEAKAPRFEAKAAAWLGF